LRICTEATGIKPVQVESYVSSAGYGSAGGQPERRAKPKGQHLGVAAEMIPSRDTSNQSEAHWPNAENSGGLGAAPPWRKIAEGTQISRCCRACKETTHSSPTARIRPTNPQRLQCRGA
jgi:hypothetical protein